MEHLPPAAGVVIRPVQPTDETPLAAFYAGLSGDSRRLRFMASTRGISPEEARAFATADHRQRDGFVAVVDGTVVGHLCLEPVAPGVEEVAVAVADRLQRRGVGRALMNAALDSAARRNVQRLEASLLGSNVPMRRLLEGAGGRILADASPDGTVRGVIEVPAARKAAA